MIEDPPAVADRLVEAAQYVPAERIAVSTACALLDLEREHAALVEGTRIARKILSGRWPRAPVPRPTAGKEEE